MTRGGRRFLPYLPNFSIANLLAFYSVSSVICFCGFDASYQLIVDRMKYKGRNGTCKIYSAEHKSLDI